MSRFGWRPWVRRGSPLWALVWIVDAASWLYGRGIHAAALFQFRRIADRYHEIAGEVYGRIGGWCLGRLGMHAIYASDELTFQRVKAVLAKGVEVGWDESNPTRHVRANRDADGFYF